jgi:hypothetical protein
MKSITSFSSFFPYSLSLSSNEKTIGTARADNPDPQVDSSFDGSGITGISGDVAGYKMESSAAVGDNYTYVGNKQ